MGEAGRGGATPGHAGERHPFGLGSYVFSGNAEQQQRVADSFHTGMVYVSGVSLDGTELPHGGVKRSRFGREPGYGMDEFITKQLIRVLR